MASRTATRCTLLALACAPLCVLGACSGNGSTSDAYAGGARAEVALGAGDAVGDRVRSVDILLTGRDAWDRDAVIDAEATRLAKLLDGRPASGAVIATEPITID